MSDCPSASDCALESTHTHPTYSLTHSVNTVMGLHFAEVTDYTVRSEVQYTQMKHVQCTILVNYFVLIVVYTSIKHKNCIFGTSVVYTVLHIPNCTVFISLRCTE